MEIGDRVKYTDYALVHDRDAYLSQGKPEKRAIYKEHYEKRLNLKGTIIQIIKAGTIAKPDGLDRIMVHYVNGFWVKWDDETISNVLPYMIEKVGNTK